MKGTLATTRTGLAPADVELMFGSGQRNRTTSETLGTRRSSRKPRHSAVSRAQGGSTGLRGRAPAATLLQESGVSDSAIRKLRQREIPLGSTPTACGAWGCFQLSPTSVARRSATFAVGPR
jgi:hypothetical protein